ncbi:MAG: ribosome-associated translation inhibitor RaiA [Labilithrix sp.]|nr:ribosome-associated translation inhibitor RaiA [Labilithrix sp.]MCW5812638.1 ribosome-associated translation inhibitor RaiA [Labilithrix sp.]
MQTPLRITFRDMAPSTFIEDHVRSRAERLERLSARITSCHVTLSLPNGFRHGSHPHVRIDLAVPGRDLVVNRDHEDDKGLRDMHACIDAAFADARRILADHVRSHRRR